MALTRPLNFPTNPQDGELFPNPAIPGSIQYVWSSTKGAWLTVNQGVQRVSGESPIVIQGSDQVPIVSITPATPAEAGSMSAADKKKLDTLSSGVSRVINGTAILVDPIEGRGDVKVSVKPPAGGVIGGVYAGTGLGTDTTGKMDLKPASTTVLGGVIVGDGLSVSPLGVLKSVGGLVVLRDLSP